MTQNIATRWTLVTLLTALLLAPGITDARPRYISKTPRTKGAQTSLHRATKSYNNARQKYSHYRGLIRRQMKRYKKSGNVQQKNYAKANAYKAGRARVSMMKAQVRGLKAKAKIAIKSGNPDLANKYLDKAAKLSSVASRTSAKLSSFAEKNGFNTAKRGRASDVGTSQTSSSKGTTTEKIAASSTGTTKKSSQTLDGENPLTDAPRGQRVPGVASHKGKRTAKLQLKSGNVLGAMDTLKRMEAQPNRKGVRGMFDRYRKWSTKRRIIKQSYKMGKAAARSGDLQLASEAIEAQTTLRKPGFWTNRRVNAIGNQALKGASKMAKTQRPEEARMMLDFARNIQMQMGRQKPTLRFRWVRRTARKRVWKDLKARAKSGNMEAFRSAMRLASAYSREDGRKMTKGDVKTVRKLYMTAMKNSVPRALKDAQLLLSGKMGYVNVEEAASRYAYAYETANKLAGRGVKVKTGFFSRGIESQFKKTRKALVVAMQNQSSLADKGRPGLARRVYEKIFLQPHKRTQPQVAPMDSRWVQKQQRAQDAEMRQMAAEQGITPEMMQQMQ